MGNEKIPENLSIKEESELNKLLSLIWDKRKQALLITVLILVIGIIYAFLIAVPMYKSTTTLYPAQEGEGNTNQLQVLASQFGIMGFGTYSNYNIPDVVKSRRMKENILSKKWSTKKNPSKKQTLYEFWKIHNKNLGKRKEIAIKKLKKLISVISNDETGLITISVLTEDPKLSAEIVNYIAQEVKKYIRTEQRKEKKKNVEFIKKRLMVIKKQLNNAEEALKEFRERNDLINSSPELQLEFARLKRNIEIRQEIYLTLEKQKELAIIEEEKEEPIIRILDIGEVPSQKYSPKRVLILLLSLIIGLSIGISSCFFDLPKINLIKK